MAVYRRKVTGVTTLRLLTKSICHLILVYGTKINDWIDTMPNPADRVVVRSWLVATQGACTILLATPDD
jgi:hypothetical protein